MCKEDHVGTSAWMLKRLQYLPACIWTNDIVSITAETLSCIATTLQYRTLPVKKRFCNHINIHLCRFQLRTTENAFATVHKRDCTEFKITKKHFNSVQFFLKGWIIGEIRTSVCETNYIKGLFSAHWVHATAMHVFVFQSQMSSRLSKSILQVLGWRNKLIV